MMNRLNEFLPTGSVAYTENLLNRSGVILRIVRGRMTKFGDFRPGKNGELHKISINRDLNRYAFLVTLIHELAHAYAHDEFGLRIKPHGKEWKSVFQRLMLPLMPYSIIDGQSQVFPDDILLPLQRHMRNPKASTSADTTLFRALKKYDAGNTIVFLEELPEGAEFKLKNGRSFVKGNKRRKNFLCISLNNNKKYLISPLAEVQRLAIKHS